MFSQSMVSQKIGPSIVVIPTVFEIILFGIGACNPPKTILGNFLIQVWLNQNSTILVEEHAFFGFACFRSFTILQDFTFSPFWEGKNKSRFLLQKGGDKNRENKSWEKEIIWWCQTKRNISHTTFPIIFLNLKDSNLFHLGYQFTILWKTR